jgi:hypothetical protein
MISYGAVQKAIHGLSFASDLDLVDKCIRVLSYCAIRDAMAGKFHDLLNSELEALRQISLPTRSLQDDVMVGASEPDDILFDFDVGSSNLHLTTRRLLNLIRRPFSGLSNIAPLSTLSNRAETIMGTHIEWAWELKGNQSPDIIAQPTAPFGMSTATNDEVQRLMAQPVGAAWSTWTPPVGI